ncbi:MAG: CinA family nicotinamide mononucleotide deamidase-related protein [Candidatus Cryptobacteroides sp.]
MENNQITASVCTIGDEILIGQIVDTNSSAIARALNEKGIKVSRMISIGDNRDQIVTSLENELKDNEIVIVTGGLGPTDDDITKPALAWLSGCETYRMDERQLSIVKEILHSRGLDLLDVNIAQAKVPESCEVILNHKGTAPIMVFPFSPERFGHKARLYSMPGVPFETIAALPDVLEDICTHFECGTITHRTVMTFGMAESALSKRIGSWEHSLPDGVHLAYLPNTLTGVRLRLSKFGGDEAGNSELLDGLFGELKRELGDIVYADSDSSLQKEVGRMLADKGLTLSVAESCTGGMVSQLITSVPGSSAYYLGSVTSYATAVKAKVLGVSEDIIREHTVISAECAAAMAEGVRRLTGSDYALATTGNAGPSASEGKEVGLLWVGVASEKGTETRSFTYRNDRARNIERFSAAALHCLLTKIKKENK